MIKKRVKYVKINQILRVDKIASRHTRENKPTKRYTCYYSYDWDGYLQTLRINDNDDNNNNNNNNNNHNSDIEDVDIIDNINNDVNALSIMPILEPQHDMDDNDDVLLLEPPNDEEEESE